MPQPGSNPAAPSNPLAPRDAALLILAAAICFRGAYCLPSCAFLMIGYLAGAWELRRMPTARRAFYGGLLLGVVTFGPQAGFFWTIFGAPAVALWLILSFWTGLFVALARQCHLRFPPAAGIFFAPFLWTGLEYFRSELYYLRFTWLNPGFAFSGSLPSNITHLIGVYGIGFVLMFVVAASCQLTRSKHFTVLAATAAFLALLINIPSFRTQPDPRIIRPLRAAGMQLEFPMENEIPARLTQLLKQHPDADLLVLSEYTLSGTVPEPIRKWCREHRRHLIIGGKDYIAPKVYYNTAFVVDPDGEIVFRQVKNVPIQFFNDGLPARSQSLWNSPWGKIGLCICYDLSYRRVTDELVRLGANAIIVPTMDVADWGLRQHALHALIAPMRAAEYGIPIFRLASSGISQSVDRFGRVLATAPFPGDAAILASTLEMGRTGSLPLDSFIGPAASAATGVLILWFSIDTMRSRRKTKFANLNS